MIDPYTLLLYAHIVLFVYWLGPDWGVYLVSSGVWRRDRTIDERIDSARLIVRMSQISRNALILLLPVGLTLAAIGGRAPIDAVGLIVIWATAVFWLLVSVVMFARRGGGLAARLNGVDAAIRWALLFGLVGLGAYAFATQQVFHDRWLAAKVVLYGLLIGNSLQQRAIARRWVTALIDMKADAARTEACEVVFAETARRSQLNAYFTWSASLTIAFLGVAKIDF
jgi:hypothetical protein